MFSAPRAGANAIIELGVAGMSRAARNICFAWAMVAGQIRAFLEDGMIRNCVNFPDVCMPRNRGHRLAAVNANVPDMLAQISSPLAGLNIAGRLNQSRGELAYPLTAVESSIPPEVLAKISAIKGVLTVRAL